jgi:hypothetical protein
MRRVTKENAIDRPSLELVQLLPFLQDEAFTTEDMEVTHLGCATMHQLVACFILMNPEVDFVRHIARGIDRLSPKPSRSPMLVEHRPSHLAQGPIFSYTHAILGRHIRTQTLMFKTQVMEKGFKARIFEFRVIVTMDRSYGIFVPLVF